MEDTVTLVTEHKVKCAFCLNYKRGEFHPNVIEGHLICHSCLKAHFSKQVYNQHKNNFIMV